MKDFWEFYNAITPSVESIANDANAKQCEVWEELHNSVDAKELLGQQIMSISFTTALELLALYHKWLFDDE